MHLASRSHNRPKLTGPRAAFAACLIALAASCSFIQLAYDNLGWLATYYASDLLDLDRDQKARFRASVDAALATHRREGMREIITALATAERFAADGFTGPELDVLQAQAIALYEDIAKRSLPLVIDVLMTLKPSQIEHLRSEIEERNTEFAERLGFNEPSETRVELRAERMAERLNFWVDELRPEQYVLLEKLAAEIPDFVDVWHDYRQSQQVRFFRLLETRDAAKLTAQLEEWWVRQSGLGRASYLRSPETQVILKRVLLKLDASFDKAQRERLIWRLGSIREDLESSMNEQG